MLDAPGEWCYNSSNDTCYFWSPDGTDPDNFSIRGSVTDYGVSISSKNYVAVQNIDFQQQKLKGVYLYDADYITVEKNKFENIDGVSIGGTAISSSNYLTIQNNQISKNNHFGIELFTLHSTITDNLIDSTALFTSLGSSGMGSSWAGSGIYFEGGGYNTASYNTITNTGYNGIHFYGRHNIIEYNFVKDCNLSKDDGGSIYCATGSTLTGQSIIRNNIVDGSWGTLNGFTTYAPAVYGEGIYVDEVCDSVTVTGNVVANVTNGGLYFNNGGYHTVTNNTVYRTEDGIVVRLRGVGINVNNNNVYGFSRDITDRQSERMANIVSVTTTPTFNNNKYVNHYKSADIFYTYVGSTGTTYSLAGWQTATSQDGSSTVDNTALTANYTERLIYNNTKSTQTWYLNNATNITDAFTDASIATSFTLSPFTGKVLEGLNLDCLGPLDNTAPTITVFDIPATGTLTIAITTFTVTGTQTKYLLTETATTPTLEQAGWVTSEPTTYTFTTSGSKTLYAWVRDAAGNISAYASDNTTVNYDLKSGLIASYEMEVDGTVLVDAHTNSLNGTNKTSADADRSVTKVSGNPGFAYPYISTGLNYSSIVDNVLLNFSGAWSASFVVNPTSLSSPRGIISKRTATTQSEFTSWVAANGSIVLIIVENGDYANRLTITTSSTGLITTGTNYLITFTSDGSDRKAGFKIFVNGEEKAVTYSYAGTVSSDLTVGIADGTSQLRIGADTFAGSNMYGNVSQVSFWNRAISTGEMLYHYNSGTILGYSSW